MIVSRCVSLSSLPFLSLSKYKLCDNTKYYRTHEPSISNCELGNVEFNLHHACEPVDVE
jgi:hypothetical protein